MRVSVMPNLTQAAWFHVNAHMLNRLISFIFCLMTFTAFAQSPPVARVSALADGKLLLNGSLADLPVIEAEFQRIKKSQGAIWYYRENPQAEPPPQAMAVIKLVIQYGLPVSMSSKSDFSDYIDGNGRSLPRKP